MCVTARYPNPIASWIIEPNDPAESTPTMATPITGSLTDQRNGAPDQQMSPSASRLPATFGFGNVPDARSSLPPDVASCTAPSTIAIPTAP